MNPVFRGIGRHQHPHLRSLILAVAVIALLGACRTVANNGEVVAESVKVVGDEGELIAWLRSDGGGAHLSLYDSKGSEKLILAVASDELTRLSFLDGSGSSRVLLEYRVTEERPDGFALLRMYDSGGVHRILIGVADYRVGFAIRDDADRMRYVLNQGGAGGVGEYFLDVDGRLKEATTE